ncbi:MAG TPA: WbuC family cupin fold metalloprotein [Cytophagales bacterium]|nr:WbuC family cupin fold metalloprotein [Cytophagales bacterium]
MIEINKELVDKVCEKANSSARLRMNHNFHENASDTMHRMINALQTGTYIRPHKHENPDKNEAFILLRGTVLIVEFDPSGNIVYHTILSHATGNYGVEIPPKTFHSLIPLEKDTVIYEVKDGPYDVKRDKIFASWSPEEGSPEGSAFNKSILDKLNIKKVED